MTDVDPFNDSRLKVENLPTEPQEVNSAGTTATVRLFRQAGETAGTRRAVSESAVANYVTGNRFMTIAADLSGSINVAGAHLSGRYRGGSNSEGHRAHRRHPGSGNAGTAAGLVFAVTFPGSRCAQRRLGIVRHFGAFTPLMYTPLRVFSQQNQDSRFALG